MHNDKIKEIWDKMDEDEKQHIGILMSNQFGDGYWQEVFAKFGLEDLYKEFNSVAELIMYDLANEYLM